jgi:hypothetical protein
MCSGVDANSWNQGLFFDSRHEPLDRLYCITRSARLSTSGGMGRHATEFIRARLLLLDFVLANQDANYFETEHDKAHFFCDELAIPKRALPTKAYEGTSTPEPTLRYFVDKFPLFLVSPAGSSSPVVTFSYVDPGHASLTGFANHR